VRVITPLEPTTIADRIAALVAKLEPLQSAA
jgi:hypothetical protein